MDEAAAGVPASPPEAPDRSPSPLSPGDGQTLLPSRLRPVRAWVRGLPGGGLIWKVTIGVLGAAIVLLGVLLVPLPGPGWAIVFVGLAVWATEFRWAHRLLRFARAVLRRWTDWARRQSLPVRVLLGLAGLAVLAGLAYLGWHFLP